MISETLPSWRRHAPAGLTLAAAKSASLRADPNPRAQADPEGLLRRIIRPDAAPRFRGLLARNYTPDRVELILRSALGGDHRQAWELFDCMEDSWAHLAKCLNELKRGVQNLQVNITPWADEGEAPDEIALRQAKIVSKAIWGMRPRPGSTESGFLSLMYDVMDAWAKGSVLLELQWETRTDPKLGTFIAPRCAEWCHPNTWAWNASGDAIGLAPSATEQTAAAAARQPGLVQATQDLLPMPPNKFIAANCRSRTTHPLGGALLRPLAFWWCAANFSAQWFLNFAQIFGLPIRWATYDPSSPAMPKLLDDLCAMLEQMGMTAWGAFPAGTTFELKEAAKTGQDNPQVSLLDRADRQCTLLILGQTLTTDISQKGGSLATAEVHESVRSDVILSAATWLAQTLHDQLIRPICLLNFGSDAQCPELELAPHKTEDAKATADRIVSIINAGIEIPKAWAFQQLNIPIPAEGEETIGKPPAPALPPPAMLPVELEASAISHPPSAIGYLSSAIQSLPDPAADIAARRRIALGSAYRGAMAPFREAILASISPADCERRLRALYADWSPQRLAAELDAALQLCAAHGAAL